MPGQGREGSPGGGGQRRIKFPGTKRVRNGRECAIRRMQPSRAGLWGFARAHKRRARRMLLGLAWERVPTAGTRQA